MYEIARKWTLSSTGAAAAEAGLGLRWSQQLTFHAWVEGGTDTATIGFEAGYTSTSSYQRLGSTAYALSTGTALIAQFDGPLRTVRPYLISRHASTTLVHVSLDGNS